MKEWEALNRLLGALGDVNRNRKGPWELSPGRAYLPLQQEFGCLGNNSLLKKGKLSPENKGEAVMIKAVWI